MGKASRAKKIRRETGEARPVKPPKVPTGKYKSKEEIQEDRRSDRRIKRASAAWIRQLVGGARIEG